MARLVCLSAHGGALGGVPVEAAASDGGHDLVLVCDVDALIAQLTRDDTAVAVLGLSLARTESLETIARVHDEAPASPVLVIALREEERFAVEAVRRGAQDCLVTGRCDAQTIVYAVACATERQRRQNALRAIALIDELTGLYNRRGFLTLARQQFRIADRLATNVWQIFLDLDGLKEINDAYGHAEGDEALIATADLLRNTFRHSDTVARIGGDEFAVLAVEAQDISTEAVMTRLYENLAARNEARGRPYALSFSLGLAFYDASEPCSVAELLARADAWMYAQKRKKRGNEKAGASIAPAPGPQAAPDPYGFQFG